MLFKGGAECRNQEQRMRWDKKRFQTLGTRGLLGAPFAARGNLNGESAPKNMAASSCGPLQHFYCIFPPTPPMTSDTTTTAGDRAMCSLRVHHIPDSRLSTVPLAPSSSVGECNQLMTAPAHCVPAFHFSRGYTTPPFLSSVNSLTA